MNRLLLLACQRLMVLRLTPADVMNR